MNRAKLFFHVALAGIIVPGAGLPLVWALSIVSYAGTPPGDEAHARWTRRLIGLALIDTVLVFALFAAVVPGRLGKVETVGGPIAVYDTPPRVMGIAFDPDDPIPRVAEVRAGFPAESAGVEVGDVIVSIDGTPTPTKTDATKAVSAQKGDAVKLELDRSGTRRELTVPLVDSRFKGPPRPLFAPESKTCPALRSANVPWGLAIVAISSLVLFFFGRRRGANATLVWTAVAMFLIAIVSEAVAYGTCREVGGTSRGGFLVSLAVQTVLVLTAGLTLRRRVPRLEKPAGAPHWLAVAGLGALYMLTLGMRAGIVLLVGKKLIGDALHGAPLQSTELGGLATSGLGVAGTLAFVVTVAVVGPIGEEWLFRGVVLPWLAGWMKPAAAIAVSAALFAALHLYYGVFALMIFVYGLVLGWVRMRSGVLRASMLLHVALNTIASAVLMLGIKAG